MKIYLASPFFNETEIKNVIKAKEILTSKQLQVYVPMDNQLNRKNKTRKQWATDTFNMDVEQIKNSDVIVMLYYGCYSDSGTAWECGLAYGLNKPVVAIHLHEGKSNCMINSSCLANLKAINELLKYDFNVMPAISYYLNEVIG